MKFAAAILFATASASVYGGYGHYPTYETSSYQKQYASTYKKMDVDAIVTELNRRNEAPIRAIREAEWSQLQSIKLSTRDAADELIATFEADILALREAAQESRDAKRAELSAANGAMRATNDALVAETAATTAALNAAQEELLAEILLADMYYDHTRIAKLLDQDGKADALTWDGEAPAAPTTAGEGYLSWNVRQPEERTYQEHYGAWGYGY